jgi:hypothetical protein
MTAKNGAVVPNLLLGVRGKAPLVPPGQATRVESPSRARNSVYGPLAAMLGLCTLILVARPNWSLYPTRVIGHGSSSEAPSSEKILGSIETAGVSRRVVGRVDGRIVLVGWAAFTDPHLSLSKIVILVDGAPRAEIHRFFDRSDIAAHFGRRDFIQSGWEVPLALSGLRPGDHNLTVEAVAQSGESDRLRPVQLRVIE